MPSDTAQILSHIPNSGIVQLPGRRFPGIVIQGDTLSNLFDSAQFLLAEFKRLRDEERYYETLMFAEQLQAQLVHYEEVLQAQGMQLPHTISASERRVTDDFNAA
jgi:type VI protein secretion system component VasF